MKIVVCVKRVPSTETTVRIASDNKSLDPSGVEYILSPFDEIALEEALKLKERLGAGAERSPTGTNSVPPQGGGEVIVLSLGPAEASTTLRTCLAMGADKGVLLKDDQAYSRDPFVVASALAATLKEIGFDLIWFGKQAVDDDNAQIGTAVARLLNLPFVNLITKFEVKDHLAILQREIDGGHEVIEVKLPAAFSAQKGLNEPRYPSLKGIMAAKKKPIEEKTPQLSNPALEITKMEYPLIRPAGRIIGKGLEAVPEAIKLLHEETKLI